MLLLLLGIALIVGVVFLFRQMSRRYMYPPMNMPPQQGYMPGSGYDGYYPYQRRSSMSPWMAGILGALGGSLLGFGVGETMEREGMMHHGRTVDADPMHG